MDQLQNWMRLWISHHHQNQFMFLALLFNSWPALPDRCNATTFTIRSQDMRHRLIVKTTIAIGASSHSVDMVGHVFNKTYVLHETLQGLKVQDFLPFWTSAIDCTTMVCAVPDQCEDYRLHMSLSCNSKDCKTNNYLLNTAKETDPLIFTWSICYDPFFKKRITQYGPSISLAWMVTIT